MLRMNTPGSAAWAFIRTRSPRTAPPENGLVGSTAITPTFMPPRRISAMRRSTSVLLPVPGAPVTPMQERATRYAGRSGQPSGGPRRPSSSTSEIALAIARASPDATRVARSVRGRESFDEDSCDEIIAARLSSSNDSRPHFSQWPATDARSRGAGSRSCPRRWS